MELELDARAIPFLGEADLLVHCKGHRLESTYRADFLCHGSVIVELKAVQALTRVAEAQVLNYLKATGLERGLLLDSGRPSPEHRRLVLARGHLT